MVTRGMLMSFTDPVGGTNPTRVPFQYNPAEVTRVLKAQRGEGGGNGLRVAGPPVETYTMKIELDALGAIEKPITGSRGVEPLLAAIEAMLEPVSGGGAGLPGATGGGGGGGAGSKSVPVPCLPLVILKWSESRMVPVRLDSFTAVESGFDTGLQPVQATVDLSFTVLRERDFHSDMTYANAMASAYQAARADSAAQGVEQGVEVAQ